MCPETPRIRLLPPAVAERIAAGEVIERPSSVVKELVENSLDAGATEITVSLEDGGKALIEVLDNGRGMDAEDLELCVKRHATSKLRTLDDLERISTMGFRGEALPSVAAAADLSILSRGQDASDDTAFELCPPRLKAQKVTFGHFLGSPHGTRIQARGLFSQIPARLKFLKSQAAEVSQVREWVERLALTHPHVGFRLLSNQRTVIDLRPMDEISRVRAILSDGQDYPVVSQESEHAFGKVRVHWLQGLSTPQTRKLVQIVNRRALRDRVLQQALLSPFRQTLLPGQFPAVVLFLQIQPDLIDVNVHPTKTEVRFLESGRIFRAVESTVQALLAQHGAHAFAAGTPLPETSSTRWQAAEPMARANAPAQEPFRFWGNPPGPGAAAIPPDVSALTPAQAPLSPAHAEMLSLLRPETYVGAIFQTYLLYDLGEELGLVDQHAAHERVRYEKLRRTVFSKDGRRLAPQQLLIPEAVHFPMEHSAQIQTRIGMLHSIGFECELFGEDVLLFRALPSEWGTDSLRTRLKSLVERLIAWDPSQSSDALVMDEALFETLASEACHSAVRAGARMTAPEAHALLSDLFRCEHPWNCPHGRPTVARVPRARFEEWFRRRV